MAKIPAAAEKDYLEKSESALAEGLKRLEDAVRILSRPSVQLGALSRLLLKSRIDIEYAGAVLTTLHEFDSWEAIPRHVAKVSGKEHVANGLVEAVHAIRSLGRPLPQDDVEILSALMLALSNVDAAVQWCEKGLQRRRPSRRDSSEQSCRSDHS